MSMDQGCLNEERMEIIQELEDFERYREKEVNKLKRKVHKTILGTNFNELEYIYICVRNNNSRFNSKVDDWTELLEVDQDGIQVEESLNTDTIMIVRISQERLL